MRIAVTGGSGEMGRALIPYLIEQGHSVVSLDRSVPQPSFPPPKTQAYYMIADMRNFGELVAAFADCQAVIHLAAHANPLGLPDSVVYADNTIGSYNALSAAAALGIQRVCLASSVNAIGGVFSRSPRYDYFPLDEQHPTYAEDPYALSKWVLEQQADAFARRLEWMTIASLRFHWLQDSRERAIQANQNFSEGAIKHLWSYILLREASRACLLAITAGFAGHEVFYIAAPRTAAPEPSLELARQYYPNTPIRGDLSDHKSFFSCAKAERLLGWRHED
jgi:nucleoside-diphosphate-sugar epimerase